MNGRVIPPLASVALIVVCGITCGCIAADEQSIAVNTTVPLERGWEQATVAILEQYMLIRANPETYNKFNGSVVSPEPAILLDSNGHPLYYRYYVQKNGENICAVQVSANKLLGTTVIRIGDFGFRGGDESMNITITGSDPGGAETEFACATPIPLYGDKYARLMLDCWEAEDAYAQNVMRDAENTGIDLSTPLSEEDQEVIREILWEEIKQREQRIREIEGKYRVNL